MLLFTIAMREKLCFWCKITYVVESRTKKLPGAAFRSNAIASSREIAGLYQNFDESRTNLTNLKFQNEIYMGKIEWGVNVTREQFVNM